MPAFDVVVLNKNPLLRTVGIIAPSVAAWLALVQLFVPAAVVLGLGALTALAIVLTRKPLEESVRLTIRPDGLYAYDSLRVPRSRIAAGYLQYRKAAPPVVRLLDPTGRRVLEAIVENGHHDEFMRALHLDDGLAPAVEFRTPGGGFLLSAAWRRVGARLTAFAFMVLLVAMGPAVALVPVLLLVGMMVQRTKVSVGADGVLIEWLWTRRFVSFADVRSAQRDTNGVMLVLGSGERVLLRTFSRRGASVEQTDALLARILEGEGAYAKGRAHKETAAHLARGDLSVDAWLHKLRALGAGAPDGYRAAAVPADELWRIVEDPSCDAGARAGAAIALRDSLDDEARTRLRVAAEACASPRVRVALERAAAPTEDGLAEALASLDEDEATARAPATSKRRSPVA